MASFLDLQNGFYNALSQGLGFPPGSPFQIAQPASPLVGGAHQDQAVWNFFNLIPPYSLTNNYVQSGGNQFFSDYSALLSTLQGAPNTFEQDIGSKCYGAWNAYAATLPLTVTLNMLPQVFQRWAAMNGYMSVANKGANDLAAMILDPITAAQLSIMPYSGTSPTNPPNWDVGFSDLVNVLAAAPSRSFNYNSATSSSNVSNTWCNGSQSAAFGLWSNSSSSSSQSQTFASSGVQLSASFQHATTFTAVPGAWYNSGAMGDAFSNQSGPPWVAGPINWKNTFDPSSGNMARFAASLVVVSGMYVEVQSAASFSQADQTAIYNNSSAGMWPFYSNNSSSGTTTSASFNNSGNMTVVITSQPGVPVVLGVVVEPVANYLGHALAGAQLYAANLKKQAA